MLFKSFLKLKVFQKFSKLGNVSAKLIENFQENKNKLKEFLSYKNFAEVGNCFGKFQKAKNSV